MARLSSRGHKKVPIYWRLTESEFSSRSMAMPSLERMLNGDSLHHNKVKILDNGASLNNNIYFRPCKSQCDQIWPWLKIGQGQHRIINWTIFVVLAYKMLHTKYQGHQSVSSGEDLRYLSYMDMRAIWVKWPRSIDQLFVPKGPGGSI